MADFVLVVYSLSSFNFQLRITWILDAVLWSSRRYRNRNYLCRPFTYISSETGSIWTKLCRQEESDCVEFSAESLKWFRLTSLKLVLSDIRRIVLQGHFPFTDFHHNWQEHNMSEFDYECYQRWLLKFLVTGSVFVKSAKKGRFWVPLVRTL